MHALCALPSPAWPQKAPLPVPGALVGPVAGAVQRFMMNGSLPTYMFNPWYTEDGMKEAQ